MPSTSNLARITFYQNHGGGPWPTPLELNQIYLLDRHDFPFPWPEETWEKLDSTTAQNLLGILKGEAGTIGFSLFRVDYPGGTAHLDKIVVSAKDRKKGLGQNLLKQSMDHLIEQGIHTFSLEVEEENQPAQALYGKLGFREIHRVKKYYSGGQNAVMMQCKPNP